MDCKKFEEVCKRATNSLTVSGILLVPDFMKVYAKREKDGKCWEFEFPAPVKFLMPRDNRKVIVYLDGLSPELIDLKEMAIHYIT